MTRSSAVGIIAWGLLLLSAPVVAFWGSQVIEARASNARPTEMAPACPTPPVQR